MRPHRRVPPPEMLSFKMPLKVPEHLRSIPPPQRFSGGLWAYCIQSENLQPGTPVTWPVLTWVLLLEQSMRSLPDLDLQLELFSRSPSTKHCWFKLRLVKPANCPGGKKFHVWLIVGSHRLLSYPVKGASNIFRSQLQIVHSVCT